MRRALTPTQCQKIGYGETPKRFEQHIFHTNHMVIRLKNSKKLPIVTLICHCHESQKKAFTLLKL